MKSVLDDLKILENAFVDTESRPVLAVMADELDSNAAVIHLVVAPYKTFADITCNGAEKTFSSSFCYTTNFSEFFRPLYDLSHDEVLKTSVKLFCDEMKTIVNDIEVDEHVREKTLSNCLINALRTFKSNPFLFYFFGFLFCKDGSDSVMPFICCASSTTANTVLDAFLSSVCSFDTLTTITDDFSISYDKEQIALKNGYYYSYGGIFTFLKLLGNYAYRSSMAFSFCKICGAPILRKTSTRMVALNVVTVCRRKTCIAKYNASLLSDMLDNGKYKEAVQLSHKLDIERINTYSEQFEDYLRFVEEHTIPLTSVLQEEIATYKELELSVRSFCERILLEICSEFYEPTGASSVKKYKTKTRDVLLGLRKRKNVVLSMLENYCYDLGIDIYL